MALYQVTKNSVIHAGIEYGQGQFIELSPELALHHAPNIQYVSGLAEQSSAQPDEDEGDVSGES